MLTDRTSESNSEYYFDYGQIVIGNIAYPGKWGRMSIATAAFTDKNSTTVMFTPANAEGEIALSKAFPAMPSGFAQILGADFTAFRFKDSDIEAADMAMDEQIAVQQLRTGVLSTDKFMSHGNIRIVRLRELGFNKQADCQDARLKAIEDGVPLDDIFV